MMRWFLVVLALSVTGCRKRAPRSVPPPPPPPPPLVIADAPQTRAYIVFGPANPEHVGLTKSIEESGVFQRILEKVTLAVRLPRDLRFEVLECEGYSYWTRSTATVTTCYGYLQNIKERLGLRAVGAVMAFTLLHELGHAFISELRLPVLAREEDAADRLAAAVFLKTGDGPPNEDMVWMTLQSVHFFQALAREGAATPWDKHLSSEQRSYELLCLLEGARPGTVSTEVLPVERSRSCAREFDQAWTAWSRLLAPHARKASGRTFW